MTEYPKAIHEMDLKEAFDKLLEYQTQLAKRENETEVLNGLIETINIGTPDLRECIALLQSRCRELTIINLKGKSF